MVGTCRGTFAGFRASMRPSRGMALPARAGRPLSPAWLTGLTRSFRDQRQPALGRQGPGCHGDALGSVCGRPWAGVPWHCPGTGDPSRVVWRRYVPTISGPGPFRCPVGQVSLAEPYCAVGRGSELCSLSIRPAASTDLQQSGTSAPMAERQREGGLGTSIARGCGGLGEELCICHLSRLSRWRRPGAAGNLCLELGNRAELVLSMEQAGEGWPGWWVQGQVASLRPGGRQGLTWGAASTGTGGDAPGLTGRWSLAAQCVPQVRCRPALAPVHQEEGHPFEMGLLVC